MLVGSWDKAEFERFVVPSDCWFWWKAVLVKSVFKSEHPRRATQTHEKHTKEPSGNFFGKRLGRICLSKERNKYNNRAHAGHTKMSK